MKYFNEFRAHYLVAFLREDLSIFTVEKSVLPTSFCKFPRERGIRGILVRSIFNIKEETPRSGTKARKSNFSAFRSSFHETELKYTKE